MIYLDNAATSRRKPTKAILSLLRENIFSANPGRSAHRGSMKVALKIERVRDIIRNTFFDGNVVFTKNCTEALNLAIMGVNPKRKVITTVFEHNSVLRPLKKLETEGKIKLIIIKPENGTLENPLKRHLSNDIDIVIFSAISNVTGESNNVEKLAKLIKSRSNATVILDVAQSAGHKKYSYDNVDIIASSGHKGLFGPQGTGFLLCKKHIKLEPLIVGGTGTSSNSIDIPKSIPEGMEAGTINSPGIISLGYGIEYANKNFSKINAKIIRLSNYLYERLKNIKNIKLLSNNNGIILFNIDKFSSGDVCDILSQKFGICARGGLHCAPLAHEYLGTQKSGAVRFSIGNNNNFFQIIKTYKALKLIADGTFD